jgi:hypothetical protein
MPNVFPLTMEYLENGLTKRELFTYGAMQALIQTMQLKFDSSKNDKIDIITSVAVQIADAQILKLNAGNVKP